MLAAAAPLPAAAESADPSADQPAAAPQLSSQAAAYYHPGMESMLYEKQADERVPVAFLAKEVTALVAMEKLKMSDTAQVTENYSAGVSALSAMHYKVGETVPVEDLLYAIFVQSADEAANILAEAAGGSLDAFVGMMNDYAAQHGASDTLFTNPHGIDDGRAHTTARDAALITAAFAENAELLKISDTVYHLSAATDMSEAREMYSSNSLIYGQSSAYDSRCTGVKNDYSEQTGYSLATVVDVGDMRYVCVVFGAGEVADGRAGSYADVTALIDWTSENFKVATILKKDDPCAEIDVKLCRKTDKIVLLAAQEVSRFMPVGYDASKIEFTPEIPESLTAPVSLGDEVGSVSILYEGKSLGKIPVVAGQDAPLDDLLYYSSRVTGFFNSPVIKAIVVVCVLIALLYILYVIYYYRKRKKYKKVKNRPMNRKK